MPAGRRSAARGTRHHRGPGHRGPGRRAALTPADVERAEAGPGADGWTDRERTLPAADDAPHHHRDMHDAARRRLRTHPDEKAAIEPPALATTRTVPRLSPDPPRWRAPAAPASPYPRAGARVPSFHSFPTNFLWKPLTQASAVRRMVGMSLTRALLFRRRHVDFCHVASAVCRHG